MTDNLCFEPKIEGINTLDLIPMDGDRGVYYIKNAGGKPELENGFFYGDDSYQFCFYAHLVIKTHPGESIRVDVFDATLQRLGQGGRFFAEKGDVSYLENNIRKVFQTFFFFDLKRKMSGSGPESGIEVIFNWGISK